MRIVIPTRGRPTSRSGEAFAEAGFDVTYVHKKGEVCGGLRNGWTTSADGISGTRAAIVRRYAGQRILMVDDDLIFRVRHKGSTKFVRCEPEDLRTMVATLDRALDHTPMAGIAEQYMATLRPVGMSRHGMVRSLYALDLSKWKPDFRVICGEDAEVCLQFIKDGHAPIILHEWTRDDQRYASGGCSVWRTPEVEAEGERQIVARFPGMAELVPAPKKISGFRVKIQWKKITPRADEPDIYPRSW